MRWDERTLVERPTLRIEHVGPVARRTAKAVTGCRVGPGRRTGGRIVETAAAGAHPAQPSSRIPYHEGVIGDRPRDDGAGSHGGRPPDVDAGHDDGTGADGAALTEDDRAHRPVVGPGEGPALPVVFYVDPDIADVPELKDLKTITLSYTFFPIEPDGPVAAGAVRARTRAGMRRIWTPSRGGHVGHLHGKCRSPRGS